MSFLVEPSVPRYDHAGSRNGVIWCQMALWSGPGAAPSHRLPGSYTWSLLELAWAEAKALGAWLVAMAMSSLLPPVVVDAPTVAASPMGTWLPVRQGARRVPRPLGLPPPAADVNVVVMEPFLLGAVSQGTVLAKITLVQLFCCQLPRVPRPAGRPPSTADPAMTVLVPLRLGGASRTTSVA